ncbi:Hypothetical protein SCF082_LOCUS52501 [Durusdinium trenchii]|uniref:Uncharacterized protein n=1 Tax=Durusdinium trenchii TaxID=1381693 RepID=A0ABP0SLX5_9DINO
MAALSERVRNYGVYVLTLWPGSVKSERSIMGAKRSAARLIDLETVRFTGNAIVQLGSLSPDILRAAGTEHAPDGLIEGDPKKSGEAQGVYSSKRRVLSSADVLGWEVDGASERPHFKLAVQAAEATHQLRSAHPLFFEWVEDPVDELNSRRSRGYQFFLFCLMAHFGVSLTGVMAAIFQYASLV